MAIAVLATVMAVVFPTLRAALLPARAFANPAAYSNIKLSPDGKSLGVITTFGDGRPSLVILNLATGQMAKLGPPVTDFVSGIVVIRNYSWVNNHRVILEPNIEGTTGAVDTDGTHWTGLTGAYIPPSLTPIKANEVIHVADDDSDSVLMLESVDSDRQSPSVLQVNADSGATGVVVDDRQGMTSWVVDQEGTVRIGVKFDGGHTSAIYRERDGAGWRPLLDFDSPGRGPWPLAIDFDGHTAYVSGLTPTGTWGIYSYDLADERRGPLILGDPNYDVISPGDFRAHAGLLFSHLKRKLVGIRYTTDMQKTVWLDRDMARLQATIDRALPGAANTITTWSRDETKFVIDSWSDRHPGVYYLFDRGSGQLRKLFNTASWISPSRMARMLPLQYHARDGLLIHGYITFPVGREHSHLPLVVLPHGGPWVRDVLSYDPWVQMIANRGYAVLQVNYRGSPGYGEAFSEAGRHQIGKGIQDDITDGVKWAIKAGIADPRRIAIVGASYGGYSVEWALENTPDLYRCGITIAGVSDWYYIIRVANLHDDTRGIYRYWSEQIGDPATDDATLREISPIYHVDRIRAPIFVVHGEADPVVPVSQSRRLVSELKSRGLPYEAMFRPDEGHGFALYQDNLDLFTRMGAFLDKNMQ